ncbi:MAG: DNA translocase FtsK [Clostridiales bacterium]|nr:DNA translocase FtsK [Clostridiales bacterium]
MASKKNTSGKSISRKNTNRKSTTNSGNKRTYNTQKKRDEAAKQSGAIQDEIILIIAMVISILILLSYFDLSGIVGKYVSGFLFGMIGLVSYALPFILFFGTAFYISNYGNPVAGRKMLSAAVFLVALTAFIQLITVDYNPDTRIFEYYTNSSNHRNGGGIIGGILVMLLYGMFDATATYIILIAMMVISLIVITGKAVFLLIARKSKRSMEERRHYRQLKKEEMELERQSMQEAKGTGGRAFKAFDIEAPSQDTTDKQRDKSKVVSLKEKRSKKKAKHENDDLPIVNLDHLFSPENADAKDLANMSTSDIHIEGVERTVSPDIHISQAGVPSYEDELKNKFGKDRSTIEEDASMVSSNVVPDNMTTTSDNTTAVEKNTSKENVSSTEVEELNINQVAEEKEYIFPPMKLLSAPKPKSGRGQMTERSIKETAAKLQSTLDSFGVRVTVTNVSCGPAVTRYELQPEHGVKVKSITSLADDIKLNLAASEIRIEAPIPGKSAVGIEVPNKENFVVTLREMLESKEFTEHSSDIAFAVGRDIGGQAMITDIAKMPHLLIAGATGSGKSVCINTLIMSILYKSNPSDVRMIMIDPKVVELNVYNGIPHLLIPVVTDPKKAAAALNWAVVEMTDRYKKFAEAGVRDLMGYNEKAREVAYLNDENCQKLPQIVIIIDELADLMMVAPGEVEDSICRLAQMARAAGIHLIIATQRPSVNVITGLIKANIPSRIAFAVSSAIDSRTIIDGSGAEKLLGKGDMLFFPSGYPKPVRIQGAYVSDKEVSSVVDFLINNNSTASYSDEVKETIENVRAVEAATAAANERDDYFVEAGRFIIEKDKASIGMLQRVYKIGFNRAARIMDQLAEVGVVGPEEGTKPRKILMSAEEYEQFIAENQIT